MNSVAGCAFFISTSSLFNVFVNSSFSAFSNSSSAFIFSTSLFSLTIFVSLLTHSLVNFSSAVSSSSCLSCSRKAAISSWCFLFSRMRSWLSSAQSRHACKSVRARQQLRARPTNLQNWQSILVLLSVSSSLSSIIQDSTLMLGLLRVSLTGKTADAGMEL